MIILAKYGTFKYGSFTYGKTAQAGDAVLLPSGTIGYIRTFLKNVGSRIIAISSTLGKHTNKGMTDSISITGVFWRNISLKRLLSRIIVISSMLGKHTNKGMTDSISITGVFWRNVSFKRLLSRIIAISSAFGKHTNKKLSNGSIGITGNALKRLFMSTGTGILYVLSQMTKTTKKLVGLISLASSIYGTFKYGEKKYTTSTWIFGNVLKKTYCSTGEGIINIIGNLFKRMFQNIGNGIVYVTKTILKKAIKLTGSAAISMQGLLQKKSQFKRNIGSGNVSITGILKSLYFYFLVSINSILQPLGLHILRDSKRDVFPSVKEETEELPGKNGVIHFDSRLGAKALKFNVVSPNDSDSSIDDLQHEYARHLDASKGLRPLVFEQDDRKTYYVKYAGKILPNRYAKWMDFIIPFKMTDPFIHGTYEKEIIGSGTAFNEGNEDTALKIVLLGPLTNPEIIIGNSTLVYSGTIADGSTVVIETESGIAIQNGDTNVLDKITGKLPYLLPPGDTEITASAQIKFYFRSRWL